MNKISLADESFVICRVCLGYKLQLLHMPNTTKIIIILRFGLFGIYTECI